MEKITTTSVLIVGGGPVGLGMALDLSSRNVPCSLIEQGDGIVRYSKMGAVSMRSMELCRRWGVSTAVRNCGFPADFPLSQVFCTSLNGHHIETLDYPSTVDAGTETISPEKRQRCPQLWFDPILARAAASRPNVDLLYRHRLVSFEQDASRVVATIENIESGQQRNVEAPYLVGCDGAGSSVRQALGIGYEGDAALSYSVGIYFTAPGLLNHQKMGLGSRYILIGEEGTWGNLTVVDAKDIWRLTVIGSQEKVESEKFDAHEWLRRCLGRDDIEYRIDAVLPWRRSRQVATHYRDRRVFLAGDACHLMSPTGGYGMNTGLGDVVDLGWKLQAALEGWAGPNLLDTYEAERQPIGWRNVNAASGNFSNLTRKISFSGVESSDAEGISARERIRSELVSGTRQEWETAGITMGYRYEGSPIVIPDGSAEPADDPSEYRPTGRPGHRAPHFVLPDGRSSLDLFGQDFVLLVFGSQGQTVLASSLLTAAEQLRIPAKLHRITDDDARALYGADLAIVRPDGHVAWRGQSVTQDPAALWKNLVGY